MAFGFSTALQANVEQYLKLGDGGFLPRNLGFIIHHYPTIKRYTASQILTMTLNKTQIKYNKSKY